MAQKVVKVKAHKDKKRKTKVSHKNDERHSTKVL